MDTEGTHRRADLRAKLRAKMRNAREGGGGNTQVGNATKAAELAQNALMSIEDPAIFEIAQKAIKTGDTSNLLKTAMSAMKTTDDAKTHASIEDDEEEAPPPMFHTSNQNEMSEDEAPPSIAPSRKKYPHI